MFEKGGFPQLDPERLFVSFSTDTLFTRNYLGDNGDGPLRYTRAGMVL